MKTFITVVALSGLLAAGNTWAEDDASKSEAFPQGWYVAPMFSFTKADKDRAAGNGKGGWLAIGHRSDIAAVELGGIYTALNGDAKLSGGVLNLMAGPFFDQAVLSHFFVLVGFGVQEERHLAVLKRDHSSGIFGDAGIGYMQPFDIFGWRPTVRAEARFRYDYEQPPHPAKTPSSFQDWIFNVGLQIPLSPPPAPPPTPKPEPVAVVPPVAPLPPPPPPEPKCEPPQPGQPVTLEGCKAGDTIVLNGVTFATNKAELDPNATTILDSAAGALNKHPELKVEVGGHTDSVGSDQHNEKLSERRARAVRDYLVSKGVAADRLSAAGYGESKPVDSNGTDEGRARNRRVELKLQGADVSNAPAESPTTETPKP